MKHVPITLALLCVLPAARVRAESASFQSEVMAVLSRAGCNQGACHGNQNGKNGFKLSLRGQDPEFDYLALTRDMLGRRTDAARPADSLILRKATATVGCRHSGRSCGSESGVTCWTCRATR